MEAKLIKKATLGDIVKRIAGQKPVYAPVKEGSKVRFMFLKQGESVFLDYANTVNAPKNLFFPQTETLMRYTRTALGSEQLVEETETFGEMILFGVRPCDVRSFKLLDMVFDQEKYRDPYYVDKRDKTTIIALACRQPPYSTCFCTSVGGHPAQADGADILISELDDDYLVEFLSPKGEKLVRLFGDLKTADEPALSRKKELSAEAEAAITSHVPATEIKTWLDNNFEHPFWDKIHQGCLGCGTCTYLCPTCHCFNISDETQDDDGIRLRTWDSCMYSIYSQETSGHNPRPGQKQRWRQRLMHKFKYFVDNHNAILCVGCGRCVMNCPVNTDIRKIVNDIAQLN